MNRRKFIGLTLLAPAMISISGRMSAFALPQNTFDSILQKAISNDWHKQCIGELTGNVAYALLGKPYVGGVLDEGTAEKCIISLDELDCVTLFESSLDIARLIRKSSLTEENLVDEVTFTRYRDGKIIDYSSRLHYTSDWIFDNVRKGVVKDLTKELGGKRINFNLFFMSKNPQYYKQLKNSPDLTEAIKKIETEINTRDYYFIPKDKIEKIEDKLQTGDIIAITTSKSGLDYSHTGLIYRTAGKSRFLHASTKKKKVVLDSPVSDYVNSVSSNTGITILRPLEPINE